LGAPGAVSDETSPSGLLRAGLDEDKLLLVLTLVIGAVVGLVVVAFILLTENLGSRLYPPGGAAWRRLLVPVAGSLISGFLLARYFPYARGSGIPQTKTALFLRDGYIRFSTVVGKFSVCSITLASGIALGREGPSVHISAGIASVLGRRLGLSPKSIRALVPVGAAAALAAAFNTPIAAVLFTLEEVMGDLHAPVLGSIVLSSATSWMVLHLLLGDEPLFHVPAYQLVHPVEFVFYAALGVAGGLVSVSFVKLLLWQRKHFLRLAQSTVWLQPAVGGLVVGALGWFVPQVLGVGYGFVGEALNGQIVLRTMALLVALKIVATATCYASGNAGGIFGPALFIGAMMGGTVGGVAHLLMPDYTGSVGAYALVGMGAAFAGIVRVPLTSVIMIFEITRDYSIIVPLMIANLVSYFISSRLQEEPIYEALQRQDGLHLPTGARAREDLVTVGHALSPEAQPLPAATTAAQALSAVDLARGAWPVVDEDGLRGMITAGQLERAVKEGASGRTLGELVPAPGPVETLRGDRFPHVHPDHPLEMALRRIAQTQLPVLPVVSRTNVREIKGAITMKDILDAYAIGRPRESAAGRRIAARTLAGLLAALVGLGVIASLVGYSYRTVRVSRGQRAYQEANELMQKERYDEAIERYRYALSVSHSVDDRLALGMALAKAGDPGEASIYLNAVLRDRPQSGPANLGLARIAAAENRLDDAVAHYQRAIYGAWPESTEENRFQARLEEVRMLAKAGRPQQARSELLAAASVLPADASARKEVGRMLIDAGLPLDASRLFHDLLQKDPHDSGASTGLGDAEFASNDYAAARDAYAGAVRIDPSNQAARQRADICEEVLAMDPKAPRLPSSVRHERARGILSGLADRLANCASLSGDPRAALDQARSLLAQSRRPLSYGDAADADIDLALRLWPALPECGIRVAPDDPLALVMAKLGRR
jgi:CIC family chloride channel protein